MYTTPGKWRSDDNGWVWNIIITPQQKWIDKLKKYAVERISNSSEIQFFCKTNNFFFIADSDTSDEGMQDKFSNKNVTISHILITTTKYYHGVFVNHQNWIEMYYMN